MKSTYKSLIFLILIFSSYSFNTRASSLSLEEIIDLGLNVLVIDTENNEEPSCEYVSHPEGSMGMSITNATKVPGSIKIYSPAGEILYYSGAYEKGESGMTIKIRGNTSAYYDKKPYKIKLQKKSDLLLRGDKKYYDKNWVLLNDYSLKVAMGFEVSRLIKMDWTPAGEYVNVILNGDYKGYYYLVESVERNQNARIDVSEDGFIIEHDPYWWNENGEYLDSEFSPSYNYTFKYPDYEDISIDQLNRIQNEIEIYESSLKNDTFEDYVDLESLAKWFLGHDILGTWDGGGANFYLYKFAVPSPSLIKFGPLWDFDSILKMENKWSGPHNQSRFATFFKSIDTPFMKNYISIWKNQGKEIKKGLEEYILYIREGKQWQGVVKSSEATAPIWGDTLNLNEISDMYEDWFNNRFEWLSQQLGEFNDEISDESGVNSIYDYDKDILKDVYNLQGIKILSKASTQEIKNLPPGIYFINHQKFVIK
ncbi:MAG: CotH kinase family protein [Muribaculaceae bacterium]|nr:CotH kinase family protein [Muribaculaceae bacterium]